MSVSICVYLSVHVSVSVSVCMHGCERVCLCVCMCVHVSASMCMCVRHAACWVCLFTFCFSLLFLRQGLSLGEASSRHPPSTPHTHTHAHLSLQSRHVAPPSCTVSTLLNYHSGPKRLLMRSGDRCLCCPYQKEDTQAMNQEGLALRCTFSSLHPINTISVVRQPAELAHAGAQ